MSGIDVNAVAGQAANKIVEILTGAGKDVAGYAAAEGKKLEVNGCDVFTFANGKIAKKDSYFKNRIA